MRERGSERGVVDRAGSSIWPALNLSSLLFSHYCQPENVEGMYELGGGVVGGAFESGHLSDQQVCFAGHGHTLVLKGHFPSVLFFLRR